MGCNAFFPGLNFPALNSWYVHSQRQNLVILFSFNHWFSMRWVNSVLSTGCRTFTSWQQLEALPSWHSMRIPQHQRGIHPRGTAAITLQTETSMRSLLDMRHMGDHWDSQFQPKSSWVFWKMMLETAAFKQAHLLLPVHKAEAGVAMSTLKIPWVKFLH